MPKHRSSQLVDYVVPTFGLPLPVNDAQCLLPPTHGRRWRYTAADLPRCADPELQALLQGGDYRTASKKPLQTKDNSVESLDALYGVERRKVFGGSKVGGRCGAGAWSCAGVPDVEKHWCECVGE